jgi:hypothetical protein
MTYGELSDLLEMRARRLGIMDDATEFLLTSYSVLQRLVDAYDLPPYIVTNPVVAVTVAGQRTYPFPDDFGRPLHAFRQLSQAGGMPGSGLSGFFLQVSTGSAQPLPQVDALTFNQSLSTQSTRPARFTRSRRTMVLDPAPDTNGGSNYTISASYVAKVERPTSLDDDILLDEPMFLVDMSLYQLALDRGLPQAAGLEKAALQSQSALVANAARQKQQFYTHTWWWSSRRH